MIKETIKKLAEKKNLSFEESRNLIDFIGEGYSTPAQIAAFLTTLKLKGETIEEISGFASRMREKALEINTADFDHVVDSCGTGGDGTNTFNISTASAILAAAAGVFVAKHSNFGMTSKCGSSSVIQALGINLVETPEQVEQSLKKYNIGFIHAPYFHKCTSFVNNVRKDIGIRTVFNFLGPLTNPAKPDGQILGVSLPELCPKMIEVLKNLGCKRALVVNGINPNMDEISICGNTSIYRLENENIDKFEINPSDFGIKTASLSNIAGDTPDINAQIIIDIFSGRIQGAKKDVLVLNAGALIWAGFKADSLEQGIKLAEETLNSGLAYKKLKELQK